MNEYRITYAIERRQAGETDFTEIGFGSSTAEGSIDAALYSVQSAVQNQQWETADGSPEPEDA